ncbi:hypothetical protein MKW92_022475, partial [Papaver armeniacum]
MDSIWKELGRKSRDLLELGRSGVVHPIVTASQKLRTNEKKDSSLAKLKLINNIWHLATSKFRGLWPHHLAISGR